MFGDLIDEEDEAVFVDSAYFSEFSEQHLIEKNCQKQRTEPSRLQYGSICLPAPLRQEMSRQCSSKPKITQIGVKGSTQIRE